MEKIDKYLIMIHVFALGFLSCLLIFGLIEMSKPPPKLFVTVDKCSEICYDNTTSMINSLLRSNAISSGGGAVLLEGYKEICKADCVISMEN